MIVWLMLSVQSDIDAKARAERESSLGAAAQVKRASCMVLHLTQEEKALLARVVESKLHALETEKMWLDLVRVGRACHVDRDDITSRSEWPAMFEQLAAAAEIQRSSAVATSPTH